MTFRLVGYDNGVPIYVNEPDTPPTAGGSGQKVDDVGLTPIHVQPSASAFADAGTSPAAITWGILGLGAALTGIFLYYFLQPAPAMPMHFDERDISDMAHKLRKDHIKSEMDNTYTLKHFFDK